MSEEAQKTETKKFYSVVNSAGRPYHYHITDYDKAVREAKKSAVSNRDDTYIMTATQLAPCPVPEVELVAVT
jgi:hypothetical protein